MAKLLSDPNVRGRPSVLGLEWGVYANNNPNGDVSALLADVLIVVACVVALYSNLMVPSSNYNLSTIYQTVVRAATPLLFSITGLVLFAAESEPARTNDDRALWNHDRRQRQPQLRCRLTACSSIKSCAYLAVGLLAALVVHPSPSLGAAW